MTTLYINNHQTDVFFNLAAEEYLLKHRPENIFMLWQNNASVILGKHQSAEAEINLDFTEEKHIDIARRYSGGGTVFHDLGNINLTFIENTNTMNFDKYAQQIIDFLSSIGIQAQTDKRLGIYIDQLKISGSAQCIYKNRVMYHCTLLHSTNLATLNACIDVHPEQVANISNTNHGYTVQSVRSQVTNISKHLQNPPDIENFKKSIFDFFFDQTTQKQIYQLNKEDVTRIEQLKQEKYAMKKWIFNRNT